MDWKYKRFLQERVFPASPDVVTEAARAYMAESLGWKTVDTPDGFSAEGYSFSHNAKANLRIQSAAAGTKVTLELLVERAGVSGFMLFDVGGYYNIQIRKWLDGIQWHIHQNLTPGQQQSPTPPMPQSNKGAACLFNGCLGFIVVMFGLWFIVTSICAVVGLITGHLYLLGRGGTLLIEGIGARIVSALILLVGVWIVWRLKKKKRFRIG